MAFLNIKDPTAIKILRTGLIDWGLRALRLGGKVAAKTGLLDANKIPSATTGKPPTPAQVINLVRQPAQVEIPKKPLELC